MKAIIFIAVVMLSGCATNSASNTNETTMLAVKKFYYGNKQYDPCIRCGEKWQQLPNWDNEAIKRRYQLGQDW